MLALCVGVAGAGELVLDVDTQTTARVLPRVAPGRVDVAVRNNHVDLASQVNALHTREWITSARAIDTGNDWVLTFWLAQPGLGVEVGSEPSRLRISPTTLPAASAEPTPPSESLASILAGTAQPVRCPVAPLPLQLLPPDQESALLDEVPPRLAVPVWTEAEPTVVGWSEIDGTRALLARGEGEPARLHYRLGALHRDLGHAREAAWYFSRSSSSAHRHQALGHLQAAAALAHVGEWEPAAAAAKLAAKAGAPPEHVLYLLGAISAQTAPGQGGAVARALAATSPEPAALALAGRMLLEAGCGAEALGALARAAPYLDSRGAARATLSIGDAQVLTGDLDAAARSYAQISGRRLSRDRAAILRSRTRILSIERASAATWPGLLAELKRDATDAGPAAAGSLYALAQAYDLLGEDAEAVTAYSTLARRFPTLLEGMVGAQHWSALETRLSVLLDAGRPLDALALHRAGWHDGLTPAVDQPSVLARVATAYGKAGLPATALSTWATIAEIERTHQLDSRETVLAIAQLYVHAGAYADALDSVAWLKRHPLPQDRRGEVALLEGHAHQGLGETSLARASFQVAAGVEATRKAASAHVALLDADTAACERAIPALTSAADDPPEGIDPATLGDALVRCHLATGNPEAAVAPALIAAGTTADDAARGVRTWQAARLTPDAGGGLLAEAASASPGVWGQLAREEQAHKAFVADFKK